MTDRRRDLVEPEGVNSGSAKDLMSGAEEDARPGGRPADAKPGPDGRPGGNGAAAMDDPVIRGPWGRDDEGEPSLEQSREEGAR